MKNLEKIRAFFSGDRFATGQGMVIDSVGEDSAVCSVRLCDEHRNVLGGVQGGLTYTLADFAFAVAANHQEPGMVTLSSTIHYLRAAKGERLVATARCVNRTRGTCVYEIDVADELGTPVALVSVSGYRVRA